MKIWFRDHSLLGAEVYFKNGHKEIPEEKPKACAGLEFFVPYGHRLQDVVCINVIELCQKLKEQAKKEAADWFEENCSGTITLKISNVNVIHDSINLESFG